MTFSLPPLPEIDDLDGGFFAASSLDVPSTSSFSALLAPEPSRSVVPFSPQQPMKITEPVGPAAKPEENVWDKALQVTEPTVRHLINFLPSSFSFFVTA